MTLDQKKNYLTILIGLIGGIKFRFIGTFYASEILIYLILIGIGFTYIRQNKYAMHLFLFAMLWLLSAFITDLITDNDTINSLKGAFNIIFFAAQFPAVYWLLYDKPERFLYYIIAVGIVSMPNFYLFQPQLNDSAFGLMGENIWKYYAMVPTAVATISWLYYKGKIGPSIASILMVGFGIFMLFHNSRNVLLTMAMAAVLLSQMGKLKRYPLNSAIPIFKHRIVRILLCLFIGAIAVSIIYESLASSGALGSYAYEKYIKQNTAENILEGGRAETFMGIELIRQSPILGHGSFAMDERDQFHREYARNHNMVYQPLPYLRKLPAHSHIVGAWMENGIGGGIFWIYVLFLLWTVFKSGAMLTVPKLLPAVIMQFTNIFWSILFSPFGSRVSVSFFLILLTVIYSKFLTNTNADLSTCRK